MGWSIGELAKVSGVTSRTLRHYDAIGLLPPAWVAESGRRHYGREELLRLQQILLLRNLGLGLGAIADILERDRQESTVAILRRHRRWLIEERERFGRLVDTVDRTIEDIEEGREMVAKEMFHGFEHDPYEAEARELHGDEAVDASKARIRGWSEEEAEKAKNGFQRVHEGLVPLQAAGVPTNDVRVQGLVAEHYECVSLFWTPDAAAYRSLGQMYVDDARFRQSIGQGNDAVVEYLRDAMAVYAEAKLSRGSPRSP